MCLTPQICGRQPLALFLRRHISLFSNNGWRKIWQSKTQDPCSTSYFKTSTVYVYSSGVTKRSAWRKSVAYEFCRFHCRTLQTRSKDIKIGVFAYFIYTMFCATLSTYHRQALVCSLIVNHRGCCYAYEYDDFSPFFRSFTHLAVSGKT